MPDVERRAQAIDMERSRIGPSNIRLTWTAEYHGPNPFAGLPVVVADLTADTLPGMGLAAIAISDLWAWSGLHEVPSEGDTDDVLLVLGRAATAWALAALNEVRGCLPHAAALRDGESVRVWLGFHRPDVSRAALQLSLRALMQLMAGQLDRDVFMIELNQLWQACRRHHPDYQARILMDGALAMDVPFLPFLPGSRYWQFGWGAKARVFMESGSNSDGVLGWLWQRNKATAKALMTAMGLQTPAHKLVSREEDLVAAVESVGFPCVVKPLDLGSGKGVTANIQSIADARAAFRVARHQSHGSVMVEAHVPGDDHRLLVIDGQLVAAIRRDPPFVVGDGVSTIFELVSGLNAMRSGNQIQRRYHRPVALDEMLTHHLGTQSLTLDDVPATGRRVTLRSNANFSTGGLCTDVTAACHPHVRAMAEQLARTSGLNAIGIDYLTADIASPPSQTGGAFIEMNTTPSMDVCIAAGWSQQSIAGMILGSAVGRIPAVLTVLSAAGMAVIGAALEKVRMADGEALVVGDRLRIGELTLCISSAEPWAAVKAGLRHHGVGSVHAICSADTLRRLGMPVDRVDRASVAMCEREAVLPPDWWGVLERHARDGVMSEPEQSILDRLLSEGARAMTGG